MLIVTSSVLTGAIDLTATGVADWIHYGLSTSSTVNRKVSPDVALPLYIHTGSVTLTRTTTFDSSVTWSDGTPTASSGASTTGIYKNGYGAGFKYIIPVSSVPREFRYYGRVTTTTAKVVCYFEDFSFVSPILSFGPSEAFLISVIFAYDGVTNLVVECYSDDISGSNSIQHQAVTLSYPEYIYWLANEEVSLSEEVTLEMSADLSLVSIDVYSETSITESVSSEADINLSVSEAVSAVDWADLGGYKIQLVSNLPTWQSSIEMSPSLQIKSNLPLWEGSGSFGFRSGSKLPVHEMTASLQEESISLSIKSNLPTYSMSSSFGFRASSKLPVLEFEGSFSTEEAFSLLSYLPFHTASLTLTEDEKFSIVSYLPFHSFSGNMVVSEELALSSKAPVHKFYATLREEDSLSIESKVPIHTAILTLTSDYFQIESNLPVHTMKASLSEGENWELESKVPVHVMQATMSSDEFVIESNLPTWGFKALLTEGEHWTLTSKLPCWEMDVDVYDPSIQIVSDLPMWMMESINDSFNNDSPDSNPLGDVDADSFSGVLRYIRP